ncbi:hypothetical protein DQQ10_11160 [Pseudochryseolinea flava]|uniref:Uncharacterized protein n=1 Tax=Pseudochryseolinea flava TaxID=2059302 RepID=A0A364Y425_9BACT|nr:hypothetical protein DQQ10_11160 [Pseudochryseolinea flava]
MKLADMPSGLGGGGSRNKAMNPDPYREVIQMRIRTKPNRSLEVRILPLQHSNRKSFDALNKTHCRVLIPIVIGMADKQ